MSNPDPRYIFLSATEIAKRTGRSRVSIHRWVREGMFPKPVKAQGRVIGWRLSDYQEWAENPSKWLSTPDEPHTKAMTNNNCHINQ